MRIKSKTLRTRDRRKVRGLATYVSERTSRKKKKLGRSLDLFPKRDHRHLIFMSGLIGSPRRVGGKETNSSLPQSRDQSKPEQSKVKKVDWATFAQAELKKSLGNSWGWNYRRGSNSCRWWQGLYLNLVNSLNSLYSIKKKAKIPPL